MYFVILSSREISQVSIAENLGRVINTSIQNSKTILEKIEKTSPNMN
jgi:hypothetical protein